MRFLLDEDVNPVVAHTARGLDLDVVSVHELDRRGLSDQDQLEFAVVEGRILVTIYDVAEIGEQNIDASIDKALEYLKNS